MDVGPQKLRKNCDLTLSNATLSHEMNVGRQKLRKIASLLCPSRPSPTKWTFDKKWGKLRFKVSPCNPFAGNGRWTSKIEEKLRYPFARNGRWTSKTEEKLRKTVSLWNLFARNWRWTSKIDEKLQFHGSGYYIYVKVSVRKGVAVCEFLCVNVFVRSLCVKVSVCKSVCVCVNHLKRCKTSM